MNIDCLSTIHFYIILKLIKTSSYNNTGLSTIHFYIILKQDADKYGNNSV